MASYEPLKMRACYKEYLWGGTRLREDFGKKDAPALTAESWELACHPDGMSTVDGGELDGKNLLDLAALDRPGYWGTAWTGERFPLMVKLIDAKQDLSVQVHPSDETALAERGEQGKAELWYVVDCAPQASLYLGLSRTVSREAFTRRAREGSLCELLNRVPVSRGDVFFIQPGTVHAIGAGILMAEIQQNSNTTFRLYDYGRHDAGGRPRALHWERAAQVASVGALVPALCRANSGAAFPEFTLQEMFSCPYFRAWRVDVKRNVTLRCDGLSFQHLLCVEGEGELVKEKKSYPLGRGQSVFLPAALGEYIIRGACRVLLTRV